MWIKVSTLYQYQQALMLAQVAYGIVNKIKNNYMKLLTLNEIILTIVEETKGLDPEFIEEIILKKVDIPSTEIVRLKEELRIDVLNQNFINIILKYSWGNFCFLTYQFGYNDTYGINWLIQRNLEYEDYSTLNEAGFIIIANGDPYTILLECASGRIYTIDSETEIEERMLIAEIFEQLVRGMGTGQYACWCKRDTEFIQLMEHITKGIGMPFWHSLVGSY